MTLTDDDDGIDRIVSSSNLHPSNLYAVNIDSLFRPEGCKVVLMD